MLKLKIMSLSGGNINEDFFDQNSELTILSEVKKLLKEESREVASKIMWAIYLLEDPGSKYYRMPREERVHEISQDFKLDEVKYKPLIDQYCKLVLSKEEIIYKAYADAMDRVSTQLTKLRVDTDSGLKSTLSILEKMPKMWDGMEKAKSQMKDASSKTQIRGNAREGAREARRRKS